MTRDGEMATRDYAELVLRGIGREPDITVVQTQQRQLKLALDCYAAPEWREEGLVQYSDAALRLLWQAAPGSDHQLAWAQAFASAARTGEHVDVLWGLLGGDVPLAGLSVDAELRWALSERLSALGAAEESLIDAELARDATASGERHAATCRAALPTAEAKEAAWAAVVDDQTLTNTIQEAAIAGFAKPDQRDLLAPYVARYFAAITDVFAQRSHQMAQQIIVGLYPSLRIEQATLDATDTWLAAADPPPGLRRPVVEARDAVERAVRAQAADRAVGGTGPYEP
jgi:aminopeptidase N